jgi:monofunctional glycosyltransferase
MVFLGGNCKRRPEEVAQMLPRMGAVANLRRNRAAQGSQRALRRFMFEGLMTQAQVSTSEHPAGPQIAATPGRLLLSWAAILFAVFFFAPYYLTCIYLLADPPFPAVILRSAIRRGGVSYEWRDLDRISPYLVAEVIAAEDGRYCRHRGVDWAALEAAAEAFAGGRKRGGGSTIPMQTAKNLFLWNRPAILRKPFEIPLAYYIDLVLGKRRVMEIYLNIIEWGPGLYGAEAAARHHFGIAAAALSAQQAAQLAAALPNPRRRDAGRPTSRLFAFAERIKTRAARQANAASCVISKRAPQFDDD